MQIEKFGECIGKIEFWLPFCASWLKLLFLWALGMWTCPESGRLWLKMTNMDFIEGTNICSISLFMQYG